MLLAATAISTLTTTESVIAYRNNQATSQVSDCGNSFEPTNVGRRNIGSQIQGNGNSVALSAQQTFPPATTGFIVTGSGTGITLTCLQGEVPGQPYSVQFNAQSDETTTSGTYTLSITDNSGQTIINRQGVFAFAETDGSTFLLFGVENIGLCSDPEGNLPMDVAVAISGDCGDDVAILYGDAWTSLTLRGNVECALV